MKEKRKEENGNEGAGGEKEELRDIEKVKK